MKRQNGEPCEEQPPANKQQRVCEEGRRVFDSMTASIRKMRESAMNDRDCVLADGLAEEFARLVSELDASNATLAEKQEIHEELRVFFDLGTPLSITMESLLKPHELGGYLFLAKEKPTTVTLTSRADDDEADEDSSAILEVDTRNFKYEENAIRYAWKALIEAYRRSGKKVEDCPELRSGKYTCFSVFPEYGPRDSSITKECVEAFVDKHMKGVYIDALVLEVYISAHQWEDE